MNPSLRRLLIISGLIIIFGVGVTMMMEHAKNNPRTLPPKNTTTENRDTHLTNDVKPDTTTTNQSAETSPLNKAGQATRDAVEAVKESGKEIAKDANDIVNDATTQVGETAKQVGEATTKAASEASRLIGEFANGLKSPSSEKAPEKETDTKESPEPVAPGK